MSRGTDFLQDSMCVQQRLRSAQMHKLIRLCSLLKTLHLGYPQNALQRLWSGCTDAQSGLSLCWSHKHPWIWNAVPLLTCSHFRYLKMQNFFMRTRKTGQTAQIRRLIWIFIWYTFQMVPFLTQRLIYLDLPLIWRAASTNMLYKLYYLASSFLKKPIDLDLHCLPLRMQIYNNNLDQVIWLAEN